jgi:hypothetical protein
MAVKKTEYVKNQGHFRCLRFSTHLLASAPSSSSARRDDTTINHEDHPAIVVAQQQKFTVPREILQYTKYL